MVKSSVEEMSVCAVHLKCCSKTQLEVRRGTSYVLKQKVWQQLSNCLLSLECLFYLLGHILHHTVANENSDLN